MKEQRKYDVIVVGAGLAGLSCAYELAARERRVLVLEEKAWPGGRTASFTLEGMPMESGLHRHIGYYSALPALLKACGVELEDIVTWEEKAEVLVKGADKKVILGLAPFWGLGKTVKGVLGNGDLLTPKDKLSLVPFFLRGFGSYLVSDKLDRYSVTEYANRCGVTRQAQRLILEPLSTGIFFRPPENYSAYAFFGLFAPTIPKFYKMRIGAYLGGMTEVMCRPIAEKITSLGGEIRYEEPVETVLVQRGRVTGVRTKQGGTYHAPQTVVAATLSAAKSILGPLKGKGDLGNLFRLPTMSACTLQLELDRPALERDVTTFGPGTDMVSFAEQSRTTFRGSRGRLSVILGNPREYVGKTAEEILPTVLEQMDSLGVHLRGHVMTARKAAEEDAFYSLDKGNQNLRPRQKTGVPGLTLAGDYTRTSSFATMEGAVLSGQKAARLLLRAGEEGILG